MIWSRRWTVQSFTAPDKEYTVARASDGSYGCSCPAWKFKRVECKHIGAIRDGIYASRGVPEAMAPGVAKLAREIIKEREAAAKVVETRHGRWSILEIE